jgi:hypothetical protein
LKTLDSPRLNANVLICAVSVIDASTAWPSPTFHSVKSHTPAPAPAAATGRVELREAAVEDQAAFPVAVDVGHGRELGVGAVLDHLEDVLHRRIDDGRSSTLPVNAT